MGGFFAKAIDKISSKKAKHVILVGLDASGKTTLIYKLQINHFYPSCGFPPMYPLNIQQGEYKNVDFTAWDSGSDPMLDVLCRHYYPATDDKITTLTFGYITE
eukprot:1093294_1